MTFKAIYFDLGGVILRTGDKTPRANLAAEFGMTYEEMDRFVFESQSARLASLGKITETQHWLDVTQRLNRPDTDMPHIRKAFFYGDQLDQEILSLLRSLRKSYKTGLISNAWNELRPWILENKFEDAFDNLIISAELGFAKPYARIYQTALDSFGVQANEAIFVDDFEKNILGCEALGMYGILFRTSQQTIEDINKLLNS